MRLDRSFFNRYVLQVAPDLLGKVLVVKSDTDPLCFPITEVEAYCGEEDQASHARFGKTPRNAIMYDEGGLVYVYLIYGVYWMLNFVTGTQGKPQAVLIRGISGFNGPGKVTKALKIDKSYHGEDLVNSNRIWLEDHDHQPGFIQKPRHGIDYAGEPWISKPWRFITTS
jgi:DNA-3-methyladenine glycosylase